MTIARDQCSKAEAVTVAESENSVERMVAPREIVANFQAVIRGKALMDLDPWIARAKRRLVAAFASSVATDKVTVSAAISSGRFTDQAEG
jgi:hypothetical protein